MFNKLKGFLFGLGLAVAGLSGAAVTFVTGTGYIGYNPLTGINGEPGVNIATGGLQYATTANSNGVAVPALVVTGTNCAAATPVIKGTLAKGAINTGTGTSTCTYTVSNMPTVSVGYTCSGTDVTTPADVLVLSASTVNGCTVTQATKASGDTIVINVSGV